MVKPIESLYVRNFEGRIEFLVGIYCIKPARSKRSGSSWTHAVPDLGIPSSFKIQAVPFANGVNSSDAVGQSTTWYTKILIPKVYHY